MITYTEADNGRTVELSVADPTNGNGTMHITLPGRFLTSDTTVTQIGPLTRIDIPRDGGRTFHATLMRVALTRRRAAR